MYVVSSIIYFSEQSNYLFAHSSFLIDQCCVEAARSQVAKNFSANHSGRKREREKGDDHVSNSESWRDLANYRCNFPLSIMKNKRSLINVSIFILTNTNEENAWLGRIRIVKYDYVNVARLQSSQNSSLYRISVTVLI